jgi:hypothetical protein
MVMRIKRLLVAVLLLGVVGLSAGAYYSRPDSDAAALRTVGVSRGAMPPPPPARWKR